MSYYLKERYKAFLEWQKKPYVVAPLSEKEHDCPTCQTHFVGNYCPRCGQSARIGRYSFKKAFLLFLDVWGLGNRGMFRTLRDLILRPGYMIRDYLSGMQMAYFPPFKMLFLLTALSLLVLQGWNIKGKNRVEEIKQELHLSLKGEQDANATTMTQKEAASKEALDNYTQKVETYTNKVLEWEETYPNSLTILCLVIFSGFFYLFFRKCPNIPGLHYSEFLVGMVYISNMLTIYSIVCNFFYLAQEIEYATWLSVPIALKQMSGFSWWRTIKALIIPLLLLVGLFYIAIIAFMVIINTT